MIKILNILTSIEDGGLEMLVYRIYRGLDKDKFSLNICSLLPLTNSFLVDDFKKICNEIVSFNFINKNLKFRDIFINLSEFIKLVKFIYKGKFDVIHSHDFFPAFITRTACFVVIIIKFGKKFKIYSTYHNIYYWLTKREHIINNILSRITDKIICVSKTVKDYAIKKEKIHEDKLKVITNAIDSNEFYRDDILREKIRKNLGYSNENIVIGNIGVISVRKGHIYMLRAFDKLRKKYDKLRLLIIGGKRSHEIEIYEELVNYINENNIQNIATLLDAKKNVNEYLNAIDIFVMPSVTEGFGLSAFEAMLAERICVFSDIPVFKEFIADGDNGYIFKGKDRLSLEKVIEKILNDYDSVKNKGPEFRKFVIEKFDYKNMINSYNELYLE